MRTRINDSSIEYEVNLNWLGVEICRLENKLKLVKSHQQEMIRQVIASSEALYYWAEGLEKTPIVFTWSAGMLEAAARAIDDPSDENILLLKFAISSLHMQSARPAKAPVRTIKKSESFYTMRKTFVTSKLHSMPGFLNRFSQRDPLMPVSQAMDDPKLAAVSDGCERQQSPMSLSSEKTKEGMSSCLDI